MPLYDPNDPPTRSDASERTDRERSELAAPSLLIAMPQVLDPFFHRSVILLLHQDDDGSFGLIVNRPTALTLTEVLDGLEIVWRGDENARSFFGGPVQPQLGTVLFPTAGAEPGPTRSRAKRDRLAELEATAECAPGVALTHHVADLGKLAADPPASFRLFLGYAGWGGGQLVEEILRDDWLIIPVRADLVFGPDPESIWDEALHSVGVDPSSLPSWSTRGEDGDGQAN